MTWSGVNHPYLRIALIVPILAGVVVATSITAQPAVIIYPGDNIQDKVNINPPGTVFIIKAGIHRRQTVWPHDNMTFIGETGAVLDGENVTATAFGRDSEVGDFVTLRNLRITRYAPAQFNGAVLGTGSTGWIVEGNEIDNNGDASVQAYGISVGSQWILRNNRIHHNGWAGITGYQCSNTRIEGNDVYANPATEFTDPVGDAANIKLYECDGFVVRGNWIHDGPEEGIWLDTNGLHATVTNTIENNWVADHGDKGIWYENSLSGVIRGNYVKNAGYRKTYSEGWMTGGGIQVTNSPDVTVADNVIVNSHNGIVGAHASGYTPGRDLVNLLIKNNTVDMFKGQSGIVADAGDPFSLAWNNRFATNRYVIVGNATPFRWDGKHMTRSEWQTAGNDADGSFAE